MRIETTVCDFCSKEAKDDEMINWVQLRPLGHTVRAFGDEDWDEKQFCGIACLIDWANSI